MSPQLIAGLIAPLLVSTGITAAIGATAAGALALGIGYVATAGALYLASSLLMSQNKPSVPKPDDGAYNLKQPVPSLAYVLGRAKKGGDYVLLEALGGNAFHIIVEAGHRVQGFVQHYLHDEAVTLDGSGNVVSPAHFQGKVNIQTRLGAKLSLYYPVVAGTFPSIWTFDHRGDGLASVQMVCTGVPSNDYLDVYPNQMPSHTCVLDGALLYDPRKAWHDPANEDTWEFSTNIALERLWHLCHPVGGKLTYADMYMPDWIAAANVCDELVTNRSGAAEPRYHGGLWFRANNDPVEIGQMLDQAAELVVYERSDGLIGVHPGCFIEPDIHLTAADIIACSYDANASLSAQILAVRGRYTSPDNAFTTVDAAIVGDPYIADDDTQRSKTVDNQVVQSHNHCQRLQQLAFKRSRSPRVTIKATYEAARLLRQRKFVRVHLPPRLDEAVIEITSAPKLSLKNLTIEFSGIVWSTNYYDFNAATDEGNPANPIVDVVYTGIPKPTGFGVEVDSEVVSGGQTAAFAIGSWDFVASTLSYEMEWQRSDGSDAAQRVVSKPGATSVRTAYLADGQAYRARARTWAVSSHSDWTDWEYFTAVADVVPPGVATSVSATGGVKQVTFNWVAPNSSNYLAVRLYLGREDEYLTALLVAAEYGSPNTGDSHTLTVPDAGTYYGWVQAINVSGYPASAVATGPITVTNPDP